MNVPDGICKGLKLVNSWGVEKMDFVPIDKKGQNVKVYVCGPTVYDSAHLGHARAYLTFDIILRIFSDYFGYDVLYVMNITDVDDKIILRARQNYLFAQYLSKENALATVEKDVEDALKMVKDKHKKKIEEFKEKEVKSKNKREKNDLKEMQENEKVKLQNVLAAEEGANKYLAQAKKANVPEEKIIGNYLDLVKSEVSYVLDKKFGSTVTDLSIFRKHAAKYEQEFLEDLNSLGIRMPAVLPRVSEYIPEIINFVKVLVDKGFAYESNGSVYFCVKELQKRRHTYGKLAPESVSSSASLEDGEGALGSSGEKKSKQDFALWKKSKDGEPRWESPWGLGRPGWHIECSAMSGTLLGNHFDIHGGGSDLKFPHHDNEIAQSEAYFGTHQWVNYWMHAGHLHVKGKKMSKSLKNFTTIRSALKAYSPRIIRLMFLLAKWNAAINFDENSLLEVIKKDKQIRGFFNDAKAAIRNRPVASVERQKWDKTDIALKDFVLETKTKVHQELCDNLNWPGAMKAISDLISEGQKYIRDHKETFKVFLLKDIIKYTTRMFKVFGLIGEDANDYSSEGKTSSGGVEDIVKPHLDAFVDFRNQMRMIAKTAMKQKDHIGKDIGKNILETCDKAREDVLPKIGVRLTDEAKDSKWNLEDPKVLLKEIAERKKGEREARMKTLQKKIGNIEKELKSMTSYKIVPTLYFREVHEDKGAFTQFDESGLPTHKSVNGEEKKIEKGRLKKLKKALKTYEKNYEKIQKKMKNDPQFEEKKKSDLDKLSADLKKLEQKE